MIAPLLLASAWGEDETRLTRGVSSDEQQGVTSAERSSTSEVTSIRIAPFSRTMVCFTDGTMPWSTQEAKKSERS